MESVEEQCHQILQKHAKSFRWAALFLGKQARDDAAIAYAFCRVVDDSVDEAPSTEQAIEALCAIEDMLAKRRAASPIVFAYMKMAERTGMGLLPAMDLILGARSDLEEVALSNDHELQTYCYQVAGTVGLMMCAILGVKDKTAHRYAVDLGIAMQLTNICRDVLEDARRQRVYLPAERLRSFGLESADVLALAEQEQPGGKTNAVRLVASEIDTGWSVGADVDRLAGCVRSLLMEAEDHYRRAARGFSFLPSRARLSIMVASRLYRQIGVRLAWNRGCNPLLGRVSVSPWEKAWLTCKVAVRWMFTLKPRDRSLALPCGETAQVRELPN